MNFKASQNPPNLGHMATLLVYINRALYVLQFLSAADGVLIPSSVQDVLATFLPELKRRTTPLRKIEEHLTWLELSKEVNDNIKIRSDVYEITAGHLMRGRVKEEDTDIPVDEGVAEYCTAALEILRETAQPHSSAFGHLPQSALVEAVGKIVDMEAAPDVILLLKRLRLYQISVVGAEITCFVDRKSAQITPPILEAGQPLVEWPAVEVIQPAPKRKKPTSGETVDDIVRGLLAVVESAKGQIKLLDAKLREEQSKNAALAKRSQELSERIQGLEIVLAILDHRLGDDTVRRLLRDRNISFPALGGSS